METSKDRRHNRETYNTSPPGSSSALEASDDSISSNVSESLDNKDEDNGEGNITETVSSMHLPILNSFLLAIWHSCHIIGNFCQDIASKVFRLVGWMEIRTMLGWIIAGVIVIYGLAILRSVFSDLLLTTLAHLFGFTYRSHEPVSFLAWVTNALHSVTSKFLWLGSAFSSSTPLQQRSSIIITNITNITNITEPICNSLWQTQSSFVWLSGITTGKFHLISAALTITRVRVDSASSIVRASGLESNEQLANAYDNVSESFEKLATGIDNFIFSTRGAILEARIWVIGTQWKLKSMGEQNLDRIGATSWPSLPLQQCNGGRVCANPFWQEFLWAGSHWPEVGTAAIALQFYCVQDEEGRAQRHEQVERIMSGFEDYLVQLQETFENMQSQAEDNIKTTGRLRNKMKLAEELRYVSSNTEAEKLAYLQIKEAQLRGVPWWMIWKEDKLTDDQLREMARIDINLATLSEVWNIEAQATIQLAAVYIHVKKSREETSLLLKQTQLIGSMMTHISEKDLLQLYERLGEILLDQMNVLEGLSANIDLSNEKVWKRLHEMEKKCTGLRSVKREQCIMEGLWLEQRIGDPEKKTDDWSFKKVQ
jgi:hypothetical protein